MALNYLNQGAKSAGLYEDLDFIREKLRYPLRSGLLLPLLAWGLLLVAVVGYCCFWLLSRAAQPGTRQFFAAFLPLVLCLPLVAGALRYMRSLKFSALQTGMDSRQNRELLTHFLQQQQLQVVNHPSSKDIFQIVSTPVSAKTKDMRQVMVFIADEGRILLNSHFSRSGFMVAPASRLHKQMQAALEAWIKSKGMQQGSNLPL